MANVPAVPDRVQAAFRKLSTSAANLNTASDDLRTVIAELDGALHKLNLGISCWVKISGGDDPRTLEFWSRDLGYARIGKTWGIALRTTEGNENFPEDWLTEEWLFNESPRWMRIEGVGKIPELLEKLSEQADSTTKKIQQKTVEAKTLAAAISQAAKTKDLILPPPKPPKASFTPEPLTAVPLSELAPKPSK